MRCQAGSMLNLDPVVIEKAVMHAFLASTHTLGSCRAVRTVSVRSANATSHHAATTAAYAGNAS